MSHPQPTMAHPAQPPMVQNRAYSPPQHSPSPTINQQPNALSQQNGRPRVSPDPRSPTFPAGFANGAGHNTAAMRTPTSGLVSPSNPPYAQHHSQAQHAQNHQPQYGQAQAMQQNGRLTPNVPAQRYSAPTAVQHNSIPITTNHTTTAQIPQSHHQIPGPGHAYSTATFSPTSNNQTPGTPGIMGPPQQTAPKPAPPVKTYAYDMDDSLAGTGINLDEEEQFMNDFETRNGFGAHAPRGRGSFYGAGLANQLPEQADGKSQEELVAEAADQAWNAAAARFAVSRVQDFLEEGFIHPGRIHARLAKIAAANNLELNLDPKVPNPNMPLGRLPHYSQWEKPQIRVTTKTSAEGALITTHGSFLPKDAYLIDQIALLSLATKERMGELLHDANMVASHRQTTAHGSVPAEWADAANAPTTPSKLDSAVSPRTNPLNQAADQASNGLPTPVSETAPTNQLADALASLGKRTRDVEEARMRKRQKRAEQAAERDKNADGSAASRAGSAAPGTPGSVAPEQPEPKPLSKKESKKAAKLLDTSSVSVNSTVNQFMGRKGKKYSWLSGGGGGSGTSTPRGSAGGLPGTGVGSSSKVAKGPLVQDASQRLGDLREDSAKGKNIQMRDWVDVLEHHCLRTDQQVLQQAYIKLDRSDWGDKAIAPTPAPAPLPSPTPPAAATPSATALAAVASPMATTPVAERMA